ncbi:hypothetical protein LCGC14_0583280 [marine sediment metagenome]|uniref:Uncharacterized protein n=1 Tax=marine sediment metagenome TaxID=412755 RepID=A0A0F9UP04_9ZZZZ
MRVRTTAPRTGPGGVYVPIGTILTHPLDGREKMRSARSEHMQLQREKGRMTMWMKAGICEPADEEAEEAIADWQQKQADRQRRQDIEDAERQQWGQDKLAKAVAARTARFAAALEAGTLPIQPTPPPIETPEPETPEEDVEDDEPTFDND